MFPAFFKWLDWNTEIRRKKIDFVKVTFYVGGLQDAVFGFEDIRRGKAPSNKTLVITKGMNMDTLAVGISKVGAKLKLKGGAGTS